MPRTTEPPNRRVLWTAKNVVPVANWIEGVEAVQGRIERALPRLLRQLGLVCPSCRTRGEATSTDAPLCARASVNFLAAGSWNRAFVVVPCGGGTSEGTNTLRELIFRVALPAIAHFSKVTAEVATMAWVRRQTEIPVPEVLAYTGDRENEVGYEWYV
jgi:hypothetical protein